MMTGHEQMPQNEPMGHSFATEVATLNQRVTNMEDGLRSIAEAVGKLGAKFDARSTTNWGPIWTAIGVMTAVLGLVGTVLYSPIKEAQIRMERDVASLERRLEAGDASIRAELVPRREHELFWKQYERSLERIVQRLDRIDGHGGPK